MADSSTEGLKARTMGASHRRTHKTNLIEYFCGELATGYAEQGRVFTALHA